jgi:hypothetical protein
MRTLIMLNLVALIMRTLIMLNLVALGTSWILLGH